MGLMQLSPAYLQMHYELDTPNKSRSVVALNIQSAREPFGLSIVVHKAVDTMISEHILLA